MGKRVRFLGSTGISPVSPPSSPGLARLGRVSTAGLTRTPPAALLLRSALAAEGARGRAFCGGPAPCSFGFGRGR